MTSNRNKSFVGISVPQCRDSGHIANDRMHSAVPVHVGVMRDGAALHVASRVQSPLPHLHPP